ncbi:MAG TPA: DsbA family protein [Caulobacteraceae bacterium]|nr:DsbA family protein [Caulobacteraceae bacterium]
MKLLSRRACTIAAAVLALAASAPALAAPQPFMGDAAVLGNAKAPITVVEYASASCPHCARFNNEVFPAFKAKYIDTGKVHYEFRELLTEPQDFAAAGFLTARCAGQANYLGVVDAIFHDQQKMYESGDLIGGLQAIGARFGLSKADMDACLRDPKAVKALQARVESAEKAGVESTPTFFINGKKLEGEQSLGDLMLVIEPMLARINAGGAG